MNASHLGNVWTEVQRAETMLYQSAVRTHIEDHRRMMASLEGPPDSVGLIIRMVSGFDPQHILAMDYLQRYPFSNLEAIEEKLEVCVEHGLMIPRPGGAYAAIDTGYRNVKTWMESTGEIMNRLPLEGTLADDAQTLVEYDHRVVTHMADTAHQREYPILANRLRGLCPNYEPLRLWHHWQLVWTMLAAREDAFWRLSKEGDMTPLACFLHRQLWFQNRRPWRARGHPQTIEDLASLAERYSPLPKKATACSEAVEQLTAQGWLDHSTKHYQITEAGLAAGDAIESAMDAELPYLWPKLTKEDTEAWYTAAQRLNTYFSRVIEISAGTR